MVSLLLGHIQLHGLQQPEQAAISYERVLQGEVDATIAALAEQGLKRCRSEDITSGAGTTPAINGAVPDLLKDPFLNTDPDQVRPAPADVVTAMPWLSSADEPLAIPAPSPHQTPQPTITPEADAAVEISISDPETKSKQQPEQPPTEQPHRNAIEPTPQEPAATDLLEKSWLRVQLQPEIKSPTDSNEPMGLINRIKEAIARSAGR